MNSGYFFLFYFQFTCLNFKQLTLTLPCGPGDAKGGMLAGLVGTSSASFSIGGIWAGVGFG